MTKARGPVASLVESLRRLEHQTTHILALRFPNFRNLEPGSTINFNFPITVLLGRNGTNKSSILHALYGAPKGNTIAEFWFETDLDAIPDTNDAGLKQSIVHKYRDKNETIVECIKARAPRSLKDPDYWEAVKPTSAYGFDPRAPRVSPVELKVLHLDFRGQLPAFDKYFYFPDERHLQQRIDYAKKKETLRREYRKQDYLRRRTRRLRDLLDNNGSNLSATELSVLGYILERQYDAGVMLEHTLFHGHRGHTILFKTAQIGQGYSEAFAGSGESAAAMLIHEIENVADGSLVLLDEPETSLHPRAQQRMLEFLADRTAKKKLQVVIATHSHHLAQGLPQRAVRVLRENSAGRITVDETISAREALHEIVTVPPGRAVLVEDERAKAVVLAELQFQGQLAAKEFQVIVRPGGTSRIYDDIRAHANAGRGDVFVILDGDHRWPQPIPASDSLPSGLAALRKLVSSLTRGKNSQGPDLDFVDSDEAIRYVEFLRGHVYFLPSTTPEALVWSETAARKILDPLPKDVAKAVDPKQRIGKLAVEVPGFSDDTVFRMLLRSFLESQSIERKQLSELINCIRALE